MHSGIDRSNGEPLPRVSCVCHRSRVGIVLVVVLVTAMVAPTGEAWAAERSVPEVSPHLQRPPDIPLERLDRPRRPPVRVNVNAASPRQLQRLPGLSETDAEKVIQGRPYKHKEELVTREILSQDAYDRIKDLLTVE